MNIRRISWAVAFAVAPPILGTVVYEPPPALSRSIECTGTGERCALDDAHATCACMSEPDSRQWK